MPYVKNNQDPIPGSPMLGLSKGPKFFWLTVRCWTYTVTWQSALGYLRNTAHPLVADLIHFVSHHWQASVAGSNPLQKDPTGLVSNVLTTVSPKALEVGVRLSDMDFIRV
ncbi:hypothetical protein PoB_005272200 [Plakobranchus ocellatus]|uniref:Uncharacterized protein n=1 Tax=Plakobranchus ocellatus TaxID=259542 RepID=A0AAV4C3N8_9GAST|nr:hypothetical protein PoB_005272200 [Plakobranchus ocellatus]